MVTVGRPLVRLDARRSIEKRRKETGRFFFQLIGGESTGDQGVALLVALHGELHHQREQDIALCRRRHATHPPTATSSTIWPDCAKEKKKGKERRNKRAFARTLVLRMGLEEGARGKSAHDHLHGHHAAAQRPVTDTQHRTHTHATHRRDTRKERVSCLGEEGRSARERARESCAPEAVGTLLAEEVGGEAAELEQPEHPARRLVRQAPLALDHVPLRAHTPVSHAQGCGDK